MIPQRKIASLDYWRALAILFVVVWHFFPFSIELGRIGVEIFFVLSGFLVSRPLIRAALSRTKIPWRNFAIARFVRIAPPYFLFLALATLVCYWAFPDPLDNVLIPREAWPSYIFLYKNYNQITPHAFGHIWSLCVEEHFYILLPVFFIIFAKCSVRTLTVLVPAVALSELFIRYAGYADLFQIRSFSFADPASTHNNFDGLMLGVLLRLIYEQNSKAAPMAARILVFFTGLFAISLSNYYASLDHATFHYYVTMKFVDSLSIAAMFWATMGFEHRLLAPLRKIAFVSYNWYLWHMAALLIAEDYIGQTWLGFGAYLVTGFLISLGLTKLIEFYVDDPFRRARSESL